jgi:anti-anti-sigma factor
MERHLTTSTISIGRQKRGAATANVAKRPSPAFDKSTRTHAARTELGAVSRSMSVWTHTLVLTGELTHRSVRTLEAEIERLCDEGVAGITLDLRQLEHIDPIGVAVVAFRSGLCQRQGRGFALIAGRRSIQYAFEQAGVTDVLPFQDDEVAARRLRASGARAALSQLS